MINDTVCYVFYYCDYTYNLDIQGLWLQVIRSKVKVLCILRNSRFDTVIYASTENDL